MEYAKDEIFNVTYNSDLNRLQMKKRGWTSRIKESIKKHKTITTITTLLMICSAINGIMIYNFKFY